MSHEQRESSAPDGAPVGEPREARPPEPVDGRPRRRRRHRRVVGPPTNPAADSSDDTVVPGEADPAPADETARDAWIRAQRPPHWG